MKLFKLLTISLLLSIGSASAYERFKYEGQLTRLYLNPGIKADKNLMIRLGNEFKAWCERTTAYAERLDVADKNKAHTYMYMARVTRLFFDYLEANVIAESSKV